jgi:hypothetical protein
MKMFARIALVLAILACGTALFLANKLGGIRDGLKRDKEQLIVEKNKLTTDLASTTDKLNTTTKALTKANEDLTATAGLLEGEKVKVAQKTQEADACKVTVAEKTTELDKTKSDLVTAQGDLKKIQDSMAAAGITDFGNVEQLRVKLSAQTEESKILGQQLLAMRDENGHMKQKVEELSVTPVNLRGTVAEIRPNWGFVVLDLGKNQRVQTNTAFLVYRDAKLVGKVQVRTVGQSTSIAEVLPEFQRADFRVGDLVVH